MEDKLIINCLHERAFRMIYENSPSSFDTLVEKDMSFSVHDRNIQPLALEMYKVTKGLAPTAISGLFLQCSNNRYTRSQSDSSIPQVNTVHEVYRTFNMELNPNYFEKC